MPSTRIDPQEAEAGLLVRSRNGDHEAFGHLVTRYQRRIWLVCRQYVGDEEADAATQDAFIKAYTSLASFDGRSALTTWLTRIAINTCLDELRRRKREGARIEPDLDDESDDPLARVPDDAADPEDRAMQRQAVARLRRSEQRLPDRQREIFRLRFYAELELEDIASSLGVHVGTVKTQLHRAVHRLRKELGELR